MFRALAIITAMILGSSLVGCIPTGQQETPPAQQEEQQPGAAEAEAAVREVVEEFGRRLQMVSLLAPPDVVKESMQEQYGELVAPGLLAQWQAAQERAPGRVTSSPWPDRIEIEAVEQESDGSYTVKGYILEVTSVEKQGGGYAARYPVTVTVAKVGDRWLITGFEQGVLYENPSYGFRFSLPASWKDYSIVMDEWQGLAVDAQEGEEPAASGPLIRIRHPQWTEEVPRQDIPIMIFTTEQWEDLQAGQFHIGAAPIGPTELGRNSQYVFALPARYNFAFPPGYEEVEEILAGNPLETFEPNPAE